MSDFFSLYLKDAGLDRDTVMENLQAHHIPVSYTHLLTGDTPFKQ